MLDALTLLAMRHSTDKWGAHFYTPLYHKHFKSRRNTPVRVLEIGVGGYSNIDEGGESLRMWADYFPNGKIVGIDIFEKRDLGHSRIAFERGSQSDRAFLAELSAKHGPFDIIVDDGSHVPEDVRIGFETLFPMMSPNGIYAVEDMQTSYWPDPFGGSLDLADTTTMIGRFKSLVDKLNHAEIKVANNLFEPDYFALNIASLNFYHNMVFVHKGDNSEPSNFFRGASQRMNLALRAIDRQLTLEPGHTGFLATRGRILEHLGRYEEAISTLRQVIELEGNAPFRMGQLAHLLNRIGRRRDAQREWKRAAALDPENESYRPSPARATKAASHKKKRPPQQDGPDAPLA